MSLFEHIKLILIVTIATGLIWLYAEGENVKPNTVTASLQFIAPPGVDLEIRPPLAQTVQVKVRCSAAKLTEVQRSLQAGPIGVKVSADPSSPDGRQVFFLRDVLANDSPLAKIGVNVVEVQPATLEAFVDTKTQIVLPVVVNTGDTQLAGAPIVTPQDVTLTVPSSLAAALRDTKLEARIDPQVISKLEVAVRQTVDADLTPPPEFRMTKTPPQLPRVKVTFTIRQLVETAVIKLVPVRLDITPADSARFTVTLSDDDRFLRDLSITGPADVLERIRKGEFDLWASLRLTSDELEKATATPAIGASAVTATKAPDILSRPPLPPSVTITPAPRPIAYTVQTRP